MAIAFAGLSCGSQVWLSPRVPSPSLLKRWLDGVEAISQLPVGKFGHLKKRYTSHLAILWIVICFRYCNRRQEAAWIKAVHDSLTYVATSLSNSFYF